MMVSANTPSADAAAPAPLSLGEAGSDTTYWMMNLIGGQYNKSPVNKNKDKVTQIPPLNLSPFPASVTVPGDKVAPAFTWNSATPAQKPPDGSSAGITALNNDTTGQIDFARSSRGPNPGETATKNFWAFGIGALDFVTFPGSLAPAKGLTQAQLIGIYTCNPTTKIPFFFDWSQVGGSPGAIVKYAPQTGSGTYSFFNTKLLNGATVDQNCDATHKSTFLQEHDGRGVTSLTAPNAIFAYDWARWRAQKTGFEQNLTNNSVLGKFGVTTPVGPSAANVNESKTRFAGTRYVYNVVRKVNHPNNAANKQQFNAVTRLVGVFGKTQGGPGFICSGKVKGSIVKAGFVPLSLFGSGGTGLPSSYCRLNPKPL